MSALLRSLRAPPPGFDVRALPPPLSPADEGGFLHAATQLMLDGGGGGGAVRSGFVDEFLANTLASRSATSRRCGSSKGCSRRRRGAPPTSPPRSAASASAGGDWNAERRTAGGGDRRRRRRRRASSRVALLCEQVELLLECQMGEHALPLARQLAALAPTRLKPWILLARAFALAANHVHALRALNSAPLPHVREPPAAALDERAMARPLDAARDAEAAAAAASDAAAAAEAAAGGGGADGGAEGGGRLVGAARRLLSATGAALPTASLRVAQVLGVGGGGSGGGGDTSRLLRLPAERLGEAEAAVYEVLVELANDLGWERFVAARAAAFEMGGADGGGGGEGGGRRLCERGLDGLVGALNADLAAFVSWEDEEAALHSKRQQRVAAGGAALLGGGDAGPGGGGGGGARRRRRSVGVGGGVVRPRAAGGTAEATRLRRRRHTRAVQHLERALDGGGGGGGGRLGAALVGAGAGTRAELEVLWTRACVALMGLHADGDAASIGEALAAAHRLLEAIGDGADDDGDGGAPREVTAAIYKMVGAHGLQAVRGAQRGALGEAHPAMNAICTRSSSGRSLGTIGRPK